MQFVSEYTLSFTGKETDRSQIDFYDVAQALLGFQRSLALTVHLVLNDEIITQAPSLRGARIIAIPPIDGSWKFTAVVIGGLATGLYHLGTAPRDTPLGHLVFSAYDYVVSQTLGFHVDYEQSLGKQYDALHLGVEQLPRLDGTRFDSLIEKCEPAIRDMHRPIIKSETAETATITARRSSGHVALGHPMDERTYQYVAFTQRAERPNDLSGRVSSYNINTYRGRIFTEESNRPIPIILAENTRTDRSVSLITASLMANARREYGRAGLIHFSAFADESRTGRVKSLYVLDVGGSEAS